MSSLWIISVTDMVDQDTMEECLMQLVELEEDHFLLGFHQQVQKDHKNVWHDRHIKQCTFRNKVPKNPDSVKFMVSTPLLPKNVFFEGNLLAQIPYFKMED